MKNQVNAFRYPHFPVPANEEQRLQYLLGLQIDPAVPIDALQALCRVAAQIADTPIALVSLIHEQDQCFAANVGPEGVTGTPRQEAFCAHAIMSDDVLHVPDATQDPRFATNPLVTGQPSIRAYAGAVLKPEADMRVGTICVIDTSPRAFSKDILAQLEDIGQAASALLIAHREKLALDAFARSETLRAAQLEHASNHDTLTGLLNQGAFVEQVTACLEKGDCGCLIISDADHFKLINDRFGHPFGDNYIKILAKALRDALPKTALVARTGGDEFAAFVATDPDISDAELEGFFARIRDATYCLATEMRPAQLGQISMGLATSPLHAREFNTLYKRADIALYHAKNAGRNHSFIYDKSFDETERLRALRTEFTHAITSNQIVPYYQPVVDIISNKIAFVEALVRWEHPERGRLGPDDFRVLLENHSTSQEITRCMVQAAINDLAHLAKLKGQSVKFNVNITTFDLLDAQFITMVSHMIAEAQIDWTDLVFEIIEDSVLQESSQTILEAINALRAHGALIALDDFGTGHATLTHLRDWPIDILKIDRSFVMDGKLDQRNAAILKAVLGLARELDITVIAEGLETLEQVKMLDQLDCRFAQGYYFAEPMPFDGLVGYSL